MNTDNSTFQCWMIEMKWSENMLFLPMHQCPSFPCKHSGQFSSFLWRGTTAHLSYGTAHAAHVSRSGSCRRIQWQGTHFSSLPWNYGKQYKGENYLICVTTKVIDNTGRGWVERQSQGWKRGREKNQWKEEKKVEKAARPFIDIKIQALKNQRKSEIRKLDHYKKHLRYESAGDTCTDCVELTSIRSQEGEDLVELGHYRSTGSSKKMHSICSRQTPDVWFLIVD